jgi:nucleoside-diphosphate-sugar epimerase
MVDRLKLFPTVNGAKYELQPVWCGDLGKAYFQVMMHEKETRNRNYILSGGSPIMLIDMFHTIENYLGKKNIYISVPFCLAYAGAILIDGITMNKKNFREKVQRLVEPRKFDHCEATQDFGFNPVTFDIGVMEEIKEYIESRKMR